jgi:glycosyltransferase involved in cell wall biosynthesis
VGRLLTEFSLLAKDFPGWKLQIIGDGPERKALETQCQRLKLLNSVEFTGEVADPYPLLARARIFVLASLFEGFPMSSLEALAHGLPVVGYRICNGVNEQVRDKENGFLVNSSEKGTLAAALRKLLKNPQLMMRMSQASRERYENLYSNSKVFSAWENMFLQAAQTSPRPSVAPLTDLLDGLVEREVYAASRI